MDSFETPPREFYQSKLKIVRLNPLTIDPGTKFLLAGIQLGGNFNMIPVRLEYDGVAVDFINDFEVENDNNLST